MRCDNAERGCGWEGTVGTLEDHVIKCDFTTATYKKNSLQFLTVDVKESFRTQLVTKESRECIMRRFTSASQIKDKPCVEKMPLSLSNPCMTTIKCAEENDLSSDEDEHVYENGWQKTDNKVLSRQVGHLQDTVSLCSKEIASLKDTIASLQGEVAALRKITQCIGYILRENELMVVSVPEFTSKKSTNTAFLSQTFYAYHPGGYKMRLHVFPGGDQNGRGSHVSVFVRLVKGPCDNKLQWPFVGTVTIQLLNQLSDEEHLCRQVAFEKCHEKFPECDLGIAKFIAHSELSGCSGRPQYLRDDTLHFRVGVSSTTNGSTLV